MKGFRFNIDRCVACHACIAGCQLENGPDIPYRTVFSESVLDYPGLPVHNISMACNHCEDAPCMSGCPVNAYYRHEKSGAVLIDESRCIGCNYCVWNCPYDAPQYNPTSRTMQKCNLCFERVGQGIDPACTTACPTGALSFSEIENQTHNNSLIGSTDIGAAIILEGSLDTGPQIIPEPQNSQNISKIAAPKGKSYLREWSLLSFSFLSSLLFVINISDRFGLLGLPPIAYIILCCITLMIPFFHLKKPLKAWRALAGVFRSPLSTEILFLLLFIISSLAGLIFEPTIFWIVSFISGLILMIAIDNIYSFSDTGIKYHPGQVFLIALLLSSFLLGEFLPFLFVVLIKLSALAYKLINTDVLKRGSVIILAYYTIIYSLCLIALKSGGTIFLLLLVLLTLSEFGLRIMYYKDFDPESLIVNFYKNNIREYEKE